MKKIISLLLAAVMAATLFVGCSGSGGEGSPAGEGSLSATKGSSLPSGSQGLTVTDQTGREVELPGEVNKVVSAYYISTSLLTALGVQDRLVGIEMKADTREIYKRAAPGLLELPAVGSGKGVNVEEIAKLGPDVVILPKKLADSVEQLETLGIAVLVIDPETMDDFLACVELLGKATGAQEKADKLVSYYRDSMRRISAKTKGVTDKPRVYLSSGRDYLSTRTSRMYQNDLIAMAGGESVSAGLTDGYWQAVSAEDLLAWDPAYFFTVSYASYTKEDILADQKLREVSAVKNGKILSFPSVLEPWDYPTPSSVLGVLWLTSELHPELYSRGDYVTEAKAFYQEYFGIEVSEADLGIVQ